jgi:CheY-like chemotaxis protein
MNDIRPADILLVEDNPGDAELVLDFLEQSKVKNTIRWVKNGEEAMRLLHNVDEYAGQPMPDLVLLDLNLPGKDGREVLSEIKADPKLTHIPVIILTSSKSDEDIARSYNLHASCYITKPLDLEQFGRTARLICDFWLSVVRFPARKGGSYA